MYYYVSVKVVVEITLTLRPVVRILFLVARLRPRLSRRRGSHSIAPAAIHASPYYSRGTTSRGLQASLLGHESVSLRRLG